jgi:RNA polymerase sigma factor (sigma-70 family)
MNPDHSLKSDNELWKMLSEDNMEAFSVLYQRHIKYLYNYGLRLTHDRNLIKDSLQELFTEFWQKRASLTEVNHVKVYLTKSLRYKLLRTITQIQNNQFLRLDDLLKEIQIPDLLDNGIESEHRKRLKDKLKNLPERQREVIYLRYYQNLDIQQISEVININYQSVSNLLHRALSNLRGVYIEKLN